MSDPFRDRHIDREKGDVAVYSLTNWRPGSGLFSLPNGPACQDVFLPQLTFIAHLGEGQHVPIALELVGGGAFAGLRRVRAMRLLNIQGIASCRVFSPNINSMALGKTDLEGSVRFDRPYRSERVRPGADQRRLTALLKHRASREQGNADNDQSKRDLFVHDVDAVQINSPFQERIAGEPLLVSARA